MIPIRRWWLLPTPQFSRFTLKEHLQETRYFDNTRFFESNFLFCQKHSLVVIHARSLTTTQPCDRLVHQSLAFHRSSTTNLSHLPPSQLPIITLTGVSGLRHQRPAGVPPLHHHHRSTPAAVFRNVSSGNFRSWLKYQSNHQLPMELLRYQDQRSTILLLVTLIENEGASWKSAENAMKLPRCCDPVNVVW